MSMISNTLTAARYFGQGYELKCNKSIEIEICAIFVPITLFAASISLQFVIINIMFIFNNTGI